MNNLNQTIDTFLAEFRVGMVEYYQEVRDEQKVMYKETKGMDIYDKYDHSFYSKHSKKDVSLATEYSQKSLEEIIDKDLASRKVRFVSSIENKLESEPTESNLTIGIDGSVNGTVSCATNTVSVYSILAGGYNIQKLHYRVLVQLIRKGK